MGASKRTDMRKAGEVVECSVAEPCGDPGTGAESAPAEDIDELNRGKGPGRKAAGPRRVTPSTPVAERAPTTPDAVTGEPMRTADDADPGDS